jgi:two-component system sensor histidine kinase KdpD
MEHMSLAELDASPRASGCVLACVGDSAVAARVIAAAARQAGLSGAPWHAVLVETPRIRRLGEAARRQALERLQQARALGAVTSVLDGDDPAAVIAGYARQHGCETVVLGRARHGVGAWSPSMARKIGAAWPELDFIEVAPRGEERGETRPDAPPVRDGAAGVSSYLAAAGASLVTALVAIPLLPLLDLANVAMLFLLTVVLVAIRSGRGPAVAATLVGFAALVLAAPRHGYGVGELKYAVALFVMLAVGLTTARLTLSLREQAQAAIGREARTRALYEFARELSVALQAEQVFDITRQFVQRTFDARGAILLPDDAGRLRYPEPAAGQALRAPAMSVLDMAAAQWAFDHAAPAGAGTATLPTNQFVYLPLVAPMRTRGVMVIWAPDKRWVLVPEQRELLDAFAALAAIALERVHYVEVAQDALVRMEGERLRNSLLAALSHDLRTPLTALVGLSESLTLSKPPLGAAQLELAAALRDEARRMSTLVANLLDMARIQSGGVKLNLQWQSAEEMIGSALRACRWQLGERKVETDVPRNLPLVRFDATLLERVLCNVLENACKYTPAQARIVIAAATRDAALAVTIRDDGPGLPEGREDALFGKFVRGERESSIPGVGLGLAICRAIVEAHGGAMRAYNDGGACFEFTLPLGEPPPLPAADNEEAAYKA